MRFAITGCDRYLNIFEAFLHAGWEPVKLFSVPASNLLDANNRIVKLAERRGVDVQMTRMQDTDLAELGERGCDALIVASYNWRIGDWSPHLKYAVNFHPSPLPIGRGPYPAVRAILEDRRTWGLTCHKLAADFDSGDILCAEDFALHDQECHESLNLKLQMASGRLARQVAENLPVLWEQATPQGSGEYWPLFTSRDRTVDFSQTVATILRQLRAFGTLQCFGFANEEPIYIQRAIGWPEAHGNRPNAVVHVDNHTLIIAAKDGYIALLEWGLIPDPEQLNLQAPATG